MTPTTETGTDEDEPARCPECGMPLTMHHDPACSQPCGRCEARDPLRQPWRTGAQVGRTVYMQPGPEPSDSDPLIGVMDTPELAEAAARAHNAEIAPATTAAHPDERGRTVVKVYIANHGKRESSWSLERTSPTDVEVEVDEATVERWREIEHAYWDHREAVYWRAVAEEHPEDFEDEGTTP